MTSLLLLRHGQIRANRRGHWHGSTDSPLTWRGRYQARRTARYLAHRHNDITAVYSSPLRRCRATAAIAAEALELEPVVVDGLSEYAIGAWEGLAFRVLAKEHDFISRATADLTFAPPGGESLAEVAARIVPAVEQIHASHSPAEQVLVVGHGAALAVALGTLIDASPAAWVNYPFANCGLTELMLSPSPYVNFFNSTRHL